MSYEYWDVNALGAIVFVFIDQVVLTQVTFQAIDIKDSRVKYIDVSLVFNGHRFCEDNSNKQDQWVNNDAWLNQIKSWQACQSPSGTFWFQIHAGSKTLVESW